MSSRGSSKTGSKAKRKASRLSAGGWLWAAALLNIGIGLLFSTATATSTVTVSGAEPTDLPRMQRAVQGLGSVPWARLIRNQASSFLTVGNHIERVEFSTNFFGRATAKVVTKLPLARLAAESNTFLDKSGTLFHLEFTEAVPKGLPTLVLDPDASEPQAALTGLWEGSAAAKAVTLLGTKVGQSDYSLAVDRQGVISLQLAGGAKVVLGSSSQLDQKIETLRKIVSTQEQEFARAKVLDLSAPDRPVISP